MPPKNKLNEKGQSLVELAMAFTLLLLLLGGVIDLGSMFYSFIALQDTAQEGVLYAASNPIDTTGIMNRINKSASYPIDAAQITDITVTCSGNPCVSTNINSCQGQEIKVEVDYNYNTIMPLIPIVIGRSTVPLKAIKSYTILQSDATIAYLKTVTQTCP